MEFPMRHECTVCGYVYDPETGDPVQEVAPKTAFDDLPEDWVCPVCGARREAFEPVPEPASVAP
jgi:rubredoxin